MFYWMRILFKSNDIPENLQLCLIFKHMYFFILLLGNQQINLFICSAK